MEKCRSCGDDLDRTVIDLGLSPLANNLPRPDEGGERTPLYPLAVMVCLKCGLAQVEYDADPVDLFEDYTYFSSWSESWVEHARELAVSMTSRLELGPRSQVVEIASNDGYLLQHFQAKGIPVLGVEPATNVAEAAQAKGIPTISKFFGADAADEIVASGVTADLLVGNNVLAHVPDLNDFVEGLSIVLAPQGVLSVEFPHVLNLLERVQFDTIYHEHFSYLSLEAVEHVFERHGLRVFDIEDVSTHGGSLRVIACHDEARHERTPAVRAVRDREKKGGLLDRSAYLGFAERAEHCRAMTDEFLTRCAEEGKTVAAYGAAAKGVTFLNYCSIGPSRIPVVADISTAKQGRLIPGVDIPIVDPESLLGMKPDYVLILAWNIADEIRAKHEPQLRGWGGHFVVAIPEMQILEYEF
ncbi:MAG TPA: class I SAM-dependent methyltransferase [Acidimicrobiales bacterium]